MRIAIIGPVFPYRGGIAHFDSHLFHYLINFGHDPQVFSFKRQYPRWLYPGMTDQDPSVKPDDVKASFGLDPFSPWTWFNCVNLIEKWQPDLVLLAWWTSFWGLPFAFITSSLKRKNIKTAYLIHNVFPHESRWWDGFVTKLAFSATDHFLVQNKTQYERLLELKPEAIIRQSPHPIYHMQINQQISKGEARKNLGIPEGTTTLLFFGIVRPYKGLKNLLEAVLLLKQNGHPVTLIIAGEFWESKTGYESMIDKLGLQNNVKIIPEYIPDEQLPLYFNASDLMVAPYVQGTQSGTVKLAFGFGLPVVLTPTLVDELINEYIGKGVTICTSPSPNDLADGILKGLQSSHPLHVIEDAIDQSWRLFIQSIQDLAKSGK